MSDYERLKDAHPRCKIVSVSNNETEQGLFVEYEDVMYKLEKLKSEELLEGVE